MPPFISSAANFVFSLCMPQNATIPPLPPGENALEDIVSFAARNGVAPWCFFRLNALGTGSDDGLIRLQQKLKMHYLQALVFNQQRWKAFQEIRELLNNHGIEAIPLKGLALAFTLYPDEALRPMGDIDLLIRPEQVFKARDLLLAHGGKSIYVPLSPLHERVHAHVSALHWKGIMVEPHQRLFALGSPLNPARVDLFASLIRPGNHPEFRVFDHPVMAYHLTAHMIKGYKMGGMRLSWLLDIALLLQRNQNQSGFTDVVTELHPPAKKDIAIGLAWASLLLSNTNEANRTLSAPFPHEALFHREQDTQQKHKKMVLHEIAHLPGINRKIAILFRELFPTPAYMNHQYGKHQGVKLLLLYVKRVLGVFR